MKKAENHFVWIKNTKVFAICDSLPDPIFECVDDIIITKEKKVKGERMKECEMAWKMFHIKRQAIRTGLSSSHSNMILSFNYKCRCVRQLI